MIKDRYGVVNEIERNRFEKKFHVPFGYDLVTFNYRKAEDACKDKGKGYVVEKISTSFGRSNERDIIYRV